MQRRALTLIALACACVSSRARATAGSSHGDETVFVVHGLGRTGLSMKRVEWTLRKSGYQVIHVSYPSTKVSISEATERWLTPAIQRNANQARRVHFVTHSLGAILLRQFLETHAIANLGRVVMIAPPNQGSELADRFCNHSLYVRATGPAGGELGCGSASVPLRLGPANFEAGIIAGDRSLNPWFSSLIPGADDGKVSVRRTALAGMQDFLVVHHSHTWIMWSGKVNTAVVSFLETGRFERSSGNATGRPLKHFLRIIFQPLA